MIRRPPRSTRTDTLFPYTTLFRSGAFGGLRGPGGVPAAVRGRWSSSEAIRPAPETGSALQDPDSGGKVPVELRPHLSGKTASLPRVGEPPIRDRAGSARKPREGLTGLDRCPQGSRLQPGRSRASGVFPETLNRRKASFALPFVPRYIRGPPRHAATPFERTYVGWGKGEWRRVK